MISTEHDIRYLRLVPNLPNLISVYQDELGFIIKAEGVSADGETLFSALLSLYEGLESKEEKLSSVKDIDYYIVYGIRRQIKTNLNLKYPTRKLQDLFESF